jgi:hypothetical protein
MTFTRRITEARERREAEKAANLAALCQPSRTLHKPTYSGGVSGEAVQKEEPLRSEAYRRLVAALPCSCGCGRVQSQAAHPNTSKGMGMKTDDRLCFPLAPECHRAFDQGAMYSKETRRLMERLWGAMTRQTIIAAGQWPKGLPLWAEDRSEA